MKALDLLASEIVTGLPVSSKTQSAMHVNLSGLKLYIFTIIGNYIMWKTGKINGCLKTINSKPYYI